MSKGKSNTIKIKQIRSAIRRPKDQTETLKGLGLNKIGRIRELNDSSDIRGMINKVSHLISIIK